jgi:hypothetical protein
LQDVVVNRVKAVIAKGARNSGILPKPRTQIYAKIVQKGPRIVFAALR